MTSSANVYFSKKSNSHFTAMAEGFRATEELVLEDQEDLLKEEILEAVDKHMADRLIRKAVTIPVSDCLATWRKAEDSKLAELESPYQLDLKQVLYSGIVELRTTSEVLIVPILTTHKGEKVPLSSNEDPSLTPYVVQRFVLIRDFTSSEAKVTDLTDRNYGKPKSFRFGSTRVPITRAIYIRLESLPFLNAIVPYVRDYHIRRQNVTSAVKASNVLVLETDLDWLLESVLPEEVGGGVDTGLDDASAIIQVRLESLLLNAENGAFVIDREKERLSYVERKNIASLVAAEKTAKETLVSVVDIPSSRYLGIRSAGANSNFGDNSTYQQTLNGMRTRLAEPLLRELDNTLLRLGQISKANFTWNPLALQESANIEKE